MMKKIGTAALLMVALCASAQNKSAGINLSLWTTMGTQPIDSTQTTYLNLGIVSKMNKLHGVGLNVLASIANNNMNGMQLSGLSNITGGSMRGVQLGGICNINGDNLSGISGAGLVTITGNHATGVLLAGLTNVAGNNSQGVMMAGCMNVTGDKASGVHLSGLCNLTGGTFNGVMATGLLNIAGQSVNGIQLAGLANVAVEQLNGMQIGLANYASKVAGLQIGLVNYYKDEMKGFQLGLINANPNTKVQLLLFGGNRTKINVGARFKNERFYTIIGGGTHYFDFSEKFSATLFYRAGLALPICQHLSISADLGYQHIEAFTNKNHGIPARLFALQGRINLEYAFTQQLGVFATTGYERSKAYNTAGTYHKGMLVEGGLTVSL